MNAVHVLILCAKTCFLSMNRRIRDGIVSIKLYKTAISSQILCATSSVLQTKTNIKDAIVGKEVYNAVRSVEGTHVPVAGVLVSSVLLLLLLLLWL